MKKYKAILKGIEWDTDGEDAKKLGLPTDTTITVEARDKDEAYDKVGDKLSDEYGYCFYGIKDLKIL